MSTLSPSAARCLASTARVASRTLKCLGYAERQSALLAIADSLQHTEHVQHILAANQQDVAEAQATNMSPANAARLVLNESKLTTLAVGLRQLADPAFVADPVDRLTKQTLIADGLVLQQRTVPLGVLLVIFESRPDVLPQLIGLSVLSANGLILKGGTEAKHTLAALYKIVTQAITTATKGQVKGDELVSLLTGRDAVATLLTLHDSIDLVIPRGGNALVAFVAANTRIPVLGHADGVCHIYLDREYGGEERLKDMIAIIVDAKTDYPAACNAAETLLIHEEVLTHTGLAASSSPSSSSSSSSSSSAVSSILSSLRSSGVVVFLGPLALHHAQQHGSSSPFFGLQPAKDLHTEYGDLRMCVEIVPDVSAAISHIHTYGSSHTECILTANAATAHTFLTTVDSACVFHNTSTRFSDGYRMGLGAEVGISTSRIHARGPVGVEGLCSTKWTMTSSKAQGQTLQPFHKGTQKFIHKQINITAKL